MHFFFEGKNRRGEVEKHWKRVEEIAKEVAELTKLRGDGQMWIEEEIIAMDWNEIAELKLKKQRLSAVESR